MLVKEELYDKVVEDRRVVDRVMSLAIVFKEVMRVVCSYVVENQSKKKTFFL